MATLSIEGTDLVVSLSPLEKAGALLGGVRVPLSAVTGVRTTDHPYRELRGLRVGTGIPWVIVLGRMVFPGGKDFVAVYGTARTLIVDLARGHGWERLLLTGDHAAVAERLRAELAARGDATAAG